MKKIFLALGLLSFLLFSGCGHKEGTISATQKSYLYFTGNTHFVKVSVDGGPKFLIHRGQNNQYSVKPGKHLVEVYRDGTLIIKREIYVGDGIAKEIEVR